jgi:hypothetical protein
MAKAICVLGMHRSGTSLVARVVNLLGAYLGEEEALMAPGDDNPEGYWERRDIYEFHERLLAELDRTWDTAFPLPESWHLSVPMEPFRRELREIVAGAFGDQKLWAWKDPRSSILLPIWQSVLEEEGIELACLLTLRNPLDVAKSLSRRNGFSEKESYGIWLNYNLGMLRDTADLPRSLVSYDRLIDDWEAELRRCGKEMNVTWKRFTRPLRKSVRNTIRTDLRHSATTMEELRATACPAPVRALYEMLHGAIAEGDGGKKADSLDIADLVSEHTAYAEMLAHDHLVAEARSQELEGRLAALDESNSSALDRLRSEEAASAELRADVAVRDTRIADLDRLVASTEARLEDLTKVFEQRDQTAQQRLASLEQRLEEGRVERVALADSLAATRTRADELADELRSLEKERRSLERDLAAGTKRAAEIEARLAESQREMHEANARLEGATAELELANKKLADATERNDLLEEYMRHTDRMHEQALESMVQRVVELHDQLRSVYGSKSWRFTAPLRFGNKLSEKVRRRLSESGDDRSGQ